MANLERSAKTGSVELPACRLTVVNRPIGTLTLDPKNPRLHSHRQIRQIAHSIEAFGFNVPILVDGQLKVIAGHGRVFACRHLGWTEIPTICLDHLSEAQKQAFMIAENRLTETSVWDERLLAGMFKELSVLDLDFSLEATGFEMGEIDMQIESLTEVPHGDDDPADLIPAETLQPAVTRVGDLWLLGRHRVYCGSALEPVAYAALMDGEQGAMVFADSPYNVAIDGHASGRGHIRH
jgi:hypothetical protein